MKPEELNSFLVKFDMTNDHFADLIDVSKLAVDTWIKGTRKIPKTTAKLVRFFDRYPQFMKEFGVL